MFKFNPPPAKPDGSPQTGNFRLFSVLIKVMLFTVSFLFLSEIVKHFFFPEYSFWPAVLITILFGILGVTAGVYYAFYPVLYAVLNRRTIELRRESEVRYRILFDRVPVGLYRSTPDGLIIAANPALVKMLGYPDLDSLLRENAYDIYVNPKDREWEQSLLEGSEVVSGIELQLRRRDGTPIWVRDTMRVVKEDEDVYYEGSLEDITERKRAEEMHSLLASIVESSDDAIIGIDLEGTIVSWNSGAERIYGYSNEEARGRSISILMTSGSAEELASIIDRVQKGEEIQHYQAVRVRKDGRKIPISLTVSLIEDGSGKILGTSEISRDITEQKQMEQYLLRTERLAAMGRIMATLSHEVKNPLQAIENNLELALDFALEPDEREDCLNLCLSETHQLIDLTQRMLGFARSNYDAVHPISILQVWQQTLAFLQPTLDKAAIRLKTELPDELPPVLGVADQIRQVLLNLVLNAIDVMPKGGLLQVAAQVKGETLVLTLTNIGPPIPEELFEHIFDPFYSTKPDGSGLGLFISHQIIQQHGGELKAENLKDNTGVSFTITLPVLQVNQLEENNPKPRVGLGEGASK